MAIGYTVVTGRACVPVRAEISRSRERIRTAAELLQQDKMRLEAKVLSQPAGSLALETHLETILNVIKEVWFTNLLTVEC